MRLDEYLVKNNFVESRNKAKELIKNEKIKVNEKIITKPSFNVENVKVEILQKIYVSRAAWKLKNYLEKYDIDFKEKEVIDVGSSTGGFSEVALEKGAKRVVCVDVGSDQLHKKIKESKKTDVFENTDIRNFYSKNRFDMLISDVSFISLIKIFDKLNELAKDEMILLFKPQFEVGIQAKRDKKGVVIDDKAIKNAQINFEKKIKEYNWEILKKEISQIKGKEGNIEYIYHLRRKID